MGRRGRSFRRSFELTTVESLDTVLPEDVEDFATWPWCKCRRTLLFNGVGVSDQPSPDVQFWLNVRQIGNCIKRTVMNLGNARQLTAITAALAYSVNFLSKYYSVVAQQAAWNLTAIHPAESGSYSDEELGVRLSVAC
jgi:hypothetical protein